MRQAGRRAAAMIAVACTTAAVQAHAAQAARQAPQVTAKCPPGPVEGGYCGDGGPVAEAKLAAPRDIAPVGGGFLIADGQNSAIRRVDDSGVISTAAGIGILGSTAPARGARASIARFAFGDPRGISALPNAGYALGGAALRAVLLVGKDGFVRTLLDRRKLVKPVDVIVRDADTLVVADAGAGRVLEVDLDGTTRMIASGLATPWQVAADPIGGGTYVSQQRTGTGGDIILVRSDGTRSVVAGPGAPGAAGALRFNRVAGVVAAGAVVVVADRAIVRAVFADGAVRVVAGLRQAGADPVSGVRLKDAEGLAMTADGRLLIADSGRDQIATVPGVPASLAAPQPQEMDDPAVDPAGRRSYPAAPAADDPHLGAGGAGRPACSQGTLSRAFKAVPAKRGEVLVRFSGKGTLQVTLVRGRGEREIYRRRFPRVDPRRRVLRVKTKRIHGSFFVRVRAPGGCRQSESKFRV